MLAPIPIGMFVRTVNKNLSIKKDIVSYIYYWDDSEH